MKSRQGKEKISRSDLETEEETGRRLTTSAANSSMPSEEPRSRQVRQRFQLTSHVFLSDSAADLNEANQIRSRFPFRNVFPWNSLLRHRFHKFRSREMFRECTTRGSIRTIVLVRRFALPTIERFVSFYDASFNIDLFIPMYIVVNKIENLKTCMHRERVLILFLLWFLIS